MIGTSSSGAPRAPGHHHPKGAALRTWEPDDLMMMIVTIVRIVSIVSILSIVSIISMSPIRLCLRGPREPSEALGRPRGLLAFALLCLALLCLPLLCFALLGFALLGFNFARLCFAFPLLRLALLC